MRQSAPVPGRAQVPRAMPGFERTKTVPFSPIVAGRGAVRLPSSSRMTKMPISVQGSGRAAASGVCGWAVGAAPVSGAESSVRHQQFCIGPMCASHQACTAASSGSAQEQEV